MASYECLRNSLTNSISLFCKLCKTAFDDHTALINQGQAVSNRFGAMQIVGYHHRRHLMFRLQLENQVVNLRGTDRIETSSRFIEQKNVRLQSQCTSKANALLHAARNIRRQFIQMAFHPHLGQQLPCPVALHGFRHFLSMMLKRKHYILLNGQRVVQRRMLKRKSHLQTDLAEMSISRPSMSCP